ncbi:phosphopantetheine-binding protein [Halobacteria archaeon AArc-m2/3/4]|uniref:Phosphopantetheine-binding protein n=1 Tax=Natronoglomus mannanivorans TaxID=2979990 RepID=A0ABT2QLS9_9EURY|nr:phosphopantetheine-binding protein [Halobacteria archaeon AArc-m2/3/4]
MAESVSDTIQNIIATVTRVDTDEFDGDTHFQDDLDVASLQIVEIAELTMQEVDGVVEIPDDDLVELETVADFTAYVEERAEPKAAN